jgi:hypothetical protein
MRICGAFVGSIIDSRGLRIFPFFIAETAESAERIKYLCALRVLCGE